MEEPNMMRARDWMTPSPLTIEPSTTLRRAVELLQRLDIRHLPVVNESHELVGMISDRDLRALSIPYFVGPGHTTDIQAALDAPVSSIMSGDVLSVEEEADAAEVIDLMLDHKIGAVPVVDADGELVGIVSYVDVLRAFPIHAAAE
jgi:acetoin utilization protein AcuB